ncbi:hypothetical protein B0H10DRAFT_2242343 [Mycena sp. CBHHK59/15]|nr:hypothetical protein B0H10DRAFT_2242343 [Mycena sp. CBHHK59/15]
MAPKDVCPAPRLLKRIKAAKVIPDRRGVRRQGRQARCRAQPPSPCQDLVPRPSPFFYTPPIAHTHAPSSASPR